MIVIIVATGVTTSSAPAPQNLPDPELAAILREIAHRPDGKVDGAVWKAGFRRPAEIHDDLDEVLQVSLTMQRLTNVWWHDAQK